MVVLGLGMGFLMQTTMLIAQNSVEQKDIGVASSAATFFRSIGGSFGVSLFGAIFNHRLYSDLVKSMGRTFADAVKSGGANSIGSGSGALPRPVIAAIADATSTSSSGRSSWPPWCRSWRSSCGRSRSAAHRPTPPPRPRPN